MQKGLGRRLILFTIMMGITVYNLIPTFFPTMGLPEEDVGKKDLPWSKSILPSKRINLGLDLQGGLHLVLGLDLDQVMVDATEMLNRNIVEDLKRRKSIETVSHGRLVDSPDPAVGRTHIELKFKSGADRDQAEEFIGRDYARDVEFVGRTDLSLRLRYRETTQTYLKNRAVSQSIETIRNRVDEFGVREPSISQQGENRIAVQFPGINDPERLKRLIGQTAKLEFKLVEQKTSEATIRGWMDEVAKAGIVFVEGGQEPFSKYLKQVNEFLKGKLPPNTEIAFERRVNRNTQEVERVPYLLEATPVLTGEHLENAFVNFNSEQFGNPEVSMSMTPMGTVELARVSGENIGRLMAIVLDGNIHSAPQIQSKIPNGQARITMGGGLTTQDIEQQAQDTALVLRAGSLPTTLEFLEERTIGPSLGRDSVEKGVAAMKIGVVLVCVFMIVYYGISGLIANIALTVNVFLILGLLAMLEATLTLPGLAGLVLTVGMAVDGNIIIFERIREELGKRSSVSAAIEAGYKNALSPILDSNITTLISGFFLYEFGTGPIKGFAVTLSLGIITTVITVLFVSRLLTDVYVHFTKGASFSIGGTISQESQQGASV